MGCVDMRRREPVGPHHGQLFEVIDRITGIHLDHHGGHRGEKVIKARVDAALEHLRKIFLKECAVLLIALGLVAHQIKNRSIGHVEPPRERLDFPVGRIAS